MKPRLSVVVCTFNRSRELKNCLASLANQSITDFEVIIIDGGSSDNTNRVIASFVKKLKLKKFVDREANLSKIRNLGWQKATSNLVAWIDDDVVTDENWAKEIIDTFDKNKKIAGVSGPTIIPQKLLQNRDVFFFYQPKGWWKLLAKFWDQFFLEGKKLQVGKLLKSGAWTPGSNFDNCLKTTGLQPVDYLEACNMTLRRNLIARVKGFDLNYQKVAEWCELDLAIRIKNLGYQLVFNPKAKVKHCISRSGVYPRRVYAQQRMENFLRFYFSHVFKPRLDYLIKFVPYLLFLNLYWSYKTIKTGNLNWLGGWPGTAVGLIKYARVKKTL